MGEGTEVTGHGGPTAGDRGARDACTLRGCCREARSATQHTTARRRVRAGRASTVTSPLSASRADEKQLPAAAEQVRERLAGVGGRAGGVRSARRQEGRVASEGDAVVGAHGRAAGGGVCVRAGCVRVRRLSAVRHGAAARDARAAARRVTPPHAARSYHAYIPLSGRPADGPGLLYTCYLFIREWRRPGAAFRLSRKLRLR